MYTMCLKAVLGAARTPKIIINYRQMTNRGILRDTRVHFNNITTDFYCVCVSGTGAFLQSTLTETDTVEISSEVQML